MGGVFGTGGGDSAGMGSILGDAGAGAAIGGPWGAAIGAGVGLVGDVLGFMGGQNTNAQQMALAQQQMAFQKDLATNAMQYRVADLKKAGLNPYLAVAGGSAQGAQAMPGAMAQLQNPAASFQAAGQQATNALQLMTQDAQIQQMKAQTRLMGVQADKTSGADTNLTNWQARVQQGIVELTQPAEAAQARAAAQLGEANTERVWQQFNSGDIAAEVKLIGAQTTLAGFQSQLAKVDAWVHTLSGIEAQYMIPIAIKQAGVQLQTSELAIPELNARANYFESWAGRMLLYQKQIESGVTTAAGAFKNTVGAFVPGGGAASTSTGSIFGNPDTVIGAPTMPR